MPKTRNSISLEELTSLVNAGVKKYVRYDEGAKLYSICRNTFIDLARNADAIYKIKGCAVVNVLKVNSFIEENLSVGV